MFPEVNGTDSSPKYKLHSTATRRRGLGQTLCLPLLDSPRWMVGRRSTGYMGADQGRTDMHDHPHSQNPKKVSLVLAEVPVSSTLLETILWLLLHFRHGAVAPWVLSVYPCAVSYNAKHSSTEYVSHPAAEPDWTLDSGWTVRLASRKRTRPSATRSGLGLAWLDPLGFWWT